MTGPKALCFSSFTLDLERQCLQGTSGEVNLRPKSFEVLRYLIEHPGRVIGKDEMMNAVWSGLTVTDDSLTQCISEIRRAVGTKGQSLIKTVAKKGYLFDAPVAALNLASPGPQGADVVRPDWRSCASVPDSGRPSLVVLPFANMSDDPGGEYFAEGITEEITTALSKWRWFLVIARNTAFSYKRRAADARQIGGDLGVRYVLEGSVRVDRHRVRITAQLIESATRQYIWADRFDGALGDVFGLQDEITRRVVNAVDPAIRFSELRRVTRKPPENMNAWVHFLRGSHDFFSYRKAAMAAAKEQFRQAIENDPDFAPAHARLGAAHGLEAILGWSDEYQHSLDSARQSAQNAISLDDLDASPHAALARALLWKRSHDLAIDAASRAIELNPNYHEAFSLLGQCLTFSGRPRDADGPFEMAIRLSPRDPLSWATHGLRALARYLAGEYDAAIVAADNSLTARPHYAVGHAVKAAVFSQLGRFEAARCEIALVAPQALANLELRWPFLNESDLEHLRVSLYRL